MAQKRSGGVETGGVFAFGSVSILSAALQWLATMMNPVIVGPGAPVFLVTE
jgi:hypothetical protein